MTYRGLAKVISGGQTGADMGGLMAARDQHIPTGGCCPAGWRTNIGPNPLLEVFGLTPTLENSYVPRTIENVKRADATILFGYDLRSAGSRMTVAECVNHSKPFLCVEFPHPHLQPVTWLDDTTDDIINFIQTHEVRMLNVAGNRDGEAGLQNFDRTRHVLVIAFTKLFSLNLLDT